MEMILEFLRSIMSEIAVGVITGAVGAAWTFLENRKKNALREIINESPLENKKFLKIAVEKSLSAGIKELNKIL